MRIEIVEHDYEEYDYEDRGIWYAVEVNGYEEDRFPMRLEAEALAQAFRDGEYAPVVPDEPDPDEAYDALCDSEA